MTFGGVEALLIPWYTQQLTGVRVVSETPSDLQAQAPLVRLVSVGGAADRSVPNRLRVIRWTAHCFADSPLDTQGLAERVYALTLGPLRGASLTGATVSMTDVVAAPAWVGYADPLIRQYVASYSATVLLT